ncbi:MAG TPA: nitrilase-related carbon-nitrogen hydrolase, partial [Phycisphaerae bacterium]|nr:nitrilase-related carbon-nitrogen hydrolase [Phycisphaerae bacterium]
YGPHLAFFWGIFGPVAVSLWTILAIWVGFFVLMLWSLARVSMVRDRPWVWMLAVPVLWMGLEYFRCELYYLKFAWLTPGIAVAASPAGDLVGLLGSYGMGFAFALAAASVESGVWKLVFKVSLIWIIVGFLIFCLAIALFLPALGKTRAAVARRVLIVGIQHEGPSAAQVVRALDAGAARYPDAALFVMSEYTLDTPPTESVTRWCREHGKYLIIGGKQPVVGSSPGITLWADTAFVVDPNGEVVFSQGKSVPIQFFDDGVPAKEQKVWDSPWGKIGVCICYDLSYTRVTDELIRQGAQIIVVPTMDAEKWGPYEHNLHARIAPLRALEYHVPIVRVGSSGISQFVGAGGETLASAPFPGQGEMLAAQIPYYPHANPHSLPLDRRVAPFCAGLTGLTALFLVTRRFLRRYVPAAHSSRTALKAGNRGTPPSVSS